MHFASHFARMRYEVRFYNQEQYFANVRKSSAWGRKYEIRLQAHSFDAFFQWSTPSVYLGRHMRIKYIPGLPPPFLHTASIKNWTVGRPGNEANYMLHTNYIATTIKHLQIIPRSGMKCFKNFCVGGSNAQAPCMNNQRTTSPL